MLLDKGPTLSYKSYNELDGTWHCGKSKRSFEVKTIDFKELPAITDIGENLIVIGHEEVEVTCQFSYYHARNKGPTHPLTVGWDGPVSENSSMVHIDTMKDDIGAFDLVSSVLKFYASSEYNGSSIVCHAMSENHSVKSSQTIQLIIDLVEASNGNANIRKHQTEASNGAMIYAAGVTISLAIVAVLCIVYWKTKRDKVILRPRRGREEGV